MNKKDFVKMIEPFTIPRMQTIMGEGLEILYPSHNRALKVKNELLFVDNMYLVYSTDKEHYYFKFKDWHNLSAGIPFNPNMKWGSGGGEQVEMLHLRPVPINIMNGGEGWHCNSYQIIPKNYLLEYLGIGNRFMNWKTNPWEAKS